jgi:hypothetical protein
LSHDAGQSAGPRLASALTIADPRRGLESPTTTDVEGEGQASRPLGSGSVPRLHGTAEASTARRRWKFGLSLFQDDWKWAPIRRRIWISRAVLLGILIVQAMLSLQLQNTAFQDEALYLYAGHLQLDHLLRGGPMRPEFAEYFSGSAVLYPTLAAAVDSAFGLAGARALSLVLMLATTILLYSFSRLLFNERTGLCAAALFGTTQSTLFLGHFATYDAMAVFLLALAAWAVVRGADSPIIPTCIVAALIMALGVAVKYATLMFVPSIVVLAALTTFLHRRWERAVLRVILLSVLTTAMLGGALALGGDGYLAGLRKTTTAREHGNSDSWDLLLSCLQWGGGLLALGLFGTVSYVWWERLGEVRRTRPDDYRVRPWRLAIGLLLCGTALLAPAYQMYLQTGVSLHKHIGYGLLFVAPVAGVGLSRIMGAHFRNPQLAIVSWVTLLTLGISQSQHLYSGWADSTQLVAMLRPELKPDGHYLVENDEVPKYYLRTETTPEQWTSTYAIDYIDRNGQRLSGERGYRAALSEGYFDVIVFNWISTKELDKTLATQLRTNQEYRMLGKVPYRTSYGDGHYEIWVKNQTA